MGRLQARDLGGEQGMRLCAAEHKCSSPLYARGDLGNLVLGASSNCGAWDEMMAAENIVQQPVGGFQSAPWQYDSHGTGNPMRNALLQTERCVAPRGNLIT